jgi:peroxiredoxin
MFKYLFIVFLFFLSCNSIKSQNCKITFEIKGAENKKGTLAYYFENQILIEKEFTFDKKGVFIYKNDEKLFKGVYAIFIDTLYSLDFLVSEDQVFTIKSSTNDIIGEMKIIGSEDNSIFSEHQKKLQLIDKKGLELQQKLSNSTNKTDSLKIETELLGLDKEFSSLWDETQNKYPNSFYAVLIKAMKVMSSNYLIEINNADFSNTGLIRTPFFYNIIRYQIKINIDKNPKEVIKLNNDFLDKFKKNDTLFNYVAGYMLNFYRTFCKIGFNDVYINLAERFLKEPFNSDIDTATSNMINNSIKFFNYSNIGQKSYKFKAITTYGDSIYITDVEGEMYLLFFWSIGCGHCETAAKSLNDYYSKLNDMNIGVIGFATDVKNIPAWKEYVEKKKYEWVNVCDVKSNYQTKEYFYVCSTPVMFVLDKNGIIVNKMYGETQITSFLEYITKN